MYALVRATTVGWGSPQTIGVLAVAAVMLIAFVVIEQRSDAPLVPFAFFRNGNVTAANATMLGAGAALLGLFYFLSLYLQKVLGYSAITAGISALPLAVGVIVAAGIASPLVARVGLRQVLVAGLVLFAGGLVWFARVPGHGSYLGEVLGPSLLIALGLGMAFLPITILSVTGVKDREYGLAAASSTPRSRSVARSAWPCCQRSRQPEPTTSQPPIPHQPGADPRLPHRVPRRSRIHPHRDHRRRVDRDSPNKAAQDIQRAGNRVNPQITRHQPGASPRAGARRSRRAINRRPAPTAKRPPFPNRRASQPHRRQPRSARKARSRLTIASMVSRSLDRTIEMATIRA